MNRKLIGILFAAMTLVLTGCPVDPTDPTDPTGPTATCDDGIQNGFEDGVDCGLDACGIGCTVCVGDVCSAPCVEAELVDGELDVSSFNPAEDIFRLFSVAVDDVGPVNDVDGDGLAEFLVIGTRTDDTTLDLSGIDLGAIDPENGPDSDGYLALVEIGFDPADLPMAFVADRGIVTFSDAPLSAEPGLVTLSDARLVEVDQSFKIVENGQCFLQATPIELAAPVAP